MYFKISRNHLLNAISIVSKAVSSNSPLPSLLGIKFDVYNDKLELTGSDSDITIKTVLNKSEDFVYQVYNEGSIVINKNYIVEIIRRIDSDVVDVEIIDGTLIKISGNNAEYNINATKPSEYPLIDLSKPTKEFSVSAIQLKKVISQTYFASSIQETRPALTGINICSNDGTLTCIATDSFRLAKKKITLDSEHDFNITVPCKSMVEISKIVGDDENIVVALSDKKIQFICENTIVQARLIESAYPDTDRIFPSVFECELVIDRKDLISAIDRQSLIKNESDSFSIIKFTVDNNEVVVSSKSQIIGSSMEKLEYVTYEGNEFNIAFSSKYILDALKGLDGKLVNIKFGGEFKPFIITSVDDSSTYQLISPSKSSY